MRLDGRRRSNNIDDRRRISGGKIAAGGGIIGVIIAVVATFMGGGDITSIFSALSDSGITGQKTEYVETDEDARLMDLSSMVLAGTEDVWTKIFSEQGWGEYRPPKMVVYRGTTSSACGQATSQIGPFYCSGDETVYIDLDFFKSMERTIGGGGDFACAYVIAHEVGHHVQHLRGTLDQAHAKMAHSSKKEANQMSVRLELQADYYAGVWAYHDNVMFNSIEPGDIENAANVAYLIGDDYLQKKAQGYEVPDSFNHGRSEWRQRWLMKGIDTGDPTGADVVYTLPYGKF